jgi:hypothetical protein
MELSREIRAFYIKLPYSRREINQEAIDGLWNMSAGLAVSAIEINQSDEILIHSEIEFSLASWNDAINYLRSSMELLNAKSGYIAIRRLIGMKDAIRTELEGYKVTKRSVYNSDIPESPDFIEDLIKLSGRNKRLRQMDDMEKLFKFIEEKEKDNKEDKD